MGTDSVDREMNLNSFLASSIHDTLKSVGVFRHVDLGLAKFEASELLEERVAHASSNDDFVSNIEHVEDEVDLISDFETSKDHKNRLVRIMEEISQVS